MALFSKKNNKGDVAEKAPKTPKKKVVAKEETVKVNTKKIVKSAGVNEPMRNILMSPRVTEKVTMLMESRNIYTFEIGQSATKRSITEVVQRLYKVKPVKVRIAAIPRKTVFVRGKVGYKGGGRKAYIYLKTGDKLDMS